MFILPELVLFFFQKRTVEYVSGAATAYLSGVHISFMLVNNI